jgi:hypothetical protein
MVLTLVAQTKAWASNLKKASGEAETFGAKVGKVMRGVGTALLGVGLAIIGFLPEFIKMGEEARKSERRLANIATQMGLFGENTDKVTRRLSKYAETLSFATGVDDELIRANEAVLLTFKNLASSANKIGGPFDRATKALLDLEAAGKDVTAVKLGRALEDPIKGLTGLTRAGIMFTKQEQEQIKALVAANDLLSAQDIILGKIEGQVGGTAEATASSTEKMNARFEDLVETLSEALLPSVDLLTDKFSKWLDSNEGKRAVEDLAQSFEDLGEWLASPEGVAQINAVGQAIKDIGTFANSTAQFLADIKWLLEAINTIGKTLFPALQLASDAWNNITIRGNTPVTPVTPGGNPSAPGGAPGRAGIQVNVTGITPTATIGKTVIDAVKTAQRLGTR